MGQAPRNKKISSQQIAVIDFETDPYQYGQIVAPFCAGYYDADEYRQFWGDDCVIQLINFLREIEPKIIYAHNGGKFDFFFLLDYIDEKLKIINGRIAQATILNNLHELRDSYLILPMPLKKSGGKKNISYRKMRKQFREKYKTEILSYLYYDCVALFEWVTAFRNDYGGGLTLAGAAFKQLKKTGYNVVNTYDDFDTTFRDFYFGGRVECFKVGAFTGDYLYVDINSAYPYAMTHKHWTSNQYVQVLMLPEKPYYFAEIIAVSRGALPLKNDDGLFFPNDDIPRTYKVSGWEIQAGLDTNTLKILKVVNCYKPLLVADFCEYVDKFFALKFEAEQRGDNTQRTFAKLMLNSAYGKFGQNGRDFEDFALCQSGQYPEGENWEPYNRNETGHAIFSKPAPVDRFYNVATAASITGFVRAFLWRAICSAEEPLYCDTDAIICKSFGGEVGDKLGQWDIEFKPTEIYIAQKKMYALKDADGYIKKACKGVRLTFNQIKGGVLKRENFVYKKPSPAFSLKYGARFFTREIDFKNIDKKVL
jgi:DNA polymerase elongation subunit (family B)